MLKKTGLALLLLAATAAQAHAEYQCSVKPRDDVIISPQSVQVKGASGDLQISPDGDVIRNGRAEPERQPAAESLQLPERAAQAAAVDRRRRAAAPEKARSSLDKVIVKELGSNSNVRNRLTTLNGQLKQQMNRIIEHRSDGLTFHHKAIDRGTGRPQHRAAEHGRRAAGQPERDGRQTGRQQRRQPATGDHGQPGRLAEGDPERMEQPEQDFQNFGRDVCNRVTALETQRKDLLKALK